MVVASAGVIEQGVCTTVYTSARPTLSCARIQLLFSLLIVVIIHFLNLSVFFFSWLQASNVLGLLKISVLKHSVLNTLCASPRPKSSVGLTEEAGFLLWGGRSPFLSMAPRGEPVGSCQGPAITWWKQESSWRSQGWSVMCQCHFSFSGRLLWPKLCLVEMNFTSSSSGTLLVRNG